MVLYACYAWAKRRNESIVSISVLFFAGAQPKNQSFFFVCFLLFEHCRFSRVDVIFLMLCLLRWSSQQFILGEYLALCPCCVFFDSFSILIRWSVYRNDCTVCEGRVAETFSSLVCEALCAGDCFFFADRMQHALRKCFWFWDNVRRGVVWSHKIQCDCTCLRLGR